MNIAQRYFLETGETVGNAVSRLSSKVGVQVAANLIGYSCSKQLRHYLSSRGIPDPWPLAKKRGRHNSIPSHIVAEFERRWRKCGSPEQAADGLGFNPIALYKRMKRDNL